MEANILQEAEKIIYGEREASYGKPSENFHRIALMFTAILYPKLKLNTQVSIREVGLLMIALKISREVNEHKRDNLVDIAGYAAATDRALSGL